jgi:hypothetical protein
MKLKYAIEFDMRVIEFEAGINFLGKAKIDGVEKNVVCTVTRELLVIEVQDICKLLIIIGLLLRP